MGTVQHSKAPGYPTRKQGIMEETVGADLLLYDAESHHAYRLSGRATALWHACDGSRPADQLIDAEDREGWEALLRLGADGLVRHAPSRMPRQGVSRRTFIRAGAGVATATAMAPLIERILVPTPAAAASGLPDPGDGGNGGDGWDDGGKGHHHHGH